MKEKFTLKVKNLRITAGKSEIAIVNEKDAREMDLHNGDRVKIENNKHSTVSIIDIAKGKEVVPPGTIGLFKEVLKDIKGKDKQTVKLTLQPKPDSINYIREKLDNKILSEDKIRSIVSDVVDNKLSDVEISYFVSGCYTNGFSDKESVALTKAMIKTGDELKLNNKMIVDKHCTGGVSGNRTTMIVVPIIAAAGLTIPKTSSRAITSPAGTADTMEILTNVEQPLDRMRSIVKRNKGCIVWGGAINLAPADDRFIQVESPLSIDAEGQLLASILAKKGSVNATHVLIDIPVGKETKINNMQDAKRLRKKFYKMGKILGMKLEVIITNGNKPIGDGIGPALEARDVLKILNREDTKPMDLEDKSLEMAGIILEMCGKCKKGKGKKEAREILDSGEALKKMRNIIKEQDHHKKSFFDIKVGKYVYDMKASKDGKIKNIENKNTAKLARYAGAPLDKEAGVFFHVKEGDKVVKGSKLLTIHANSAEKLNFAKNLLKKMKIIDLE